LKIDGEDCMRTETRVINGVSVTVALPEGNDSWKGSIISIPELRSIPHHLCVDQDTYSIDGLGIFTYHADSYEAESDNVLIPFDAPDSIGRWKLQGAYGTGGGSGLPDPSGKAGEVLFSDGSAYVLRKFKASDIQPDFTASFSCSVGIVEQGFNVVNPTLSMSYNDIAQSARYKDSDTNVWEPILPNVTSVVLQTSYVRNSPSGLTFTLEAVGPEGEIVTRTAGITWRARRYWGAGNGILPADVPALSSSDLQAGRGNTLNVTAGAGLLITYAIPSGQGTPVFSVGGFVGGFHLAASNVDVTNILGVTSPYDIYQSDNVGLGTTTVVVS
jgi:hypothetical protein